MPVQAQLKSSGITIGALARIVGIQTSAIRYYEAAGLMPTPARRSGRRLYGMGDVQRLRALATARRLGFSIRELRALAVADRTDRQQAARERVRAIRALISDLSSSATVIERLAECQCTTDSDCALAQA